MRDVARPAVAGEKSLILVSLCNVGDQTPSSLLLVDVLSWEVTPLAVAAGAGATGLCRIGDEILVAYQTAESSVAVLDARTLQVRREVPLPGAHDVHSLVAWGDGVAVASSGTDEVLWYRYDGSVLVDRTVLWTAGAARRDTVHVNGLTTHGDALICCAFGARRSDTDLWSESRDGFVYDVENERVLLDGLAHPHSVTSLGAECSYANRRENAFVRSTGRSRSCTATRAVSHRSTARAWSLGRAADA